MQLSHQSAKLGTRCLLNDVIFSPLRRDPSPVIPPVAIPHSFGVGHSGSRIVVAGDIPGRRWPGRIRRKIPSAGEGRCTGRPAIISAVSTIPLWCALSPPSVSDNRPISHGKKLNKDQRLELGFCEKYFFYCFPTGKNQRRAKNKSHTEEFVK